MVGGAGDGVVASVASTGSVSNCIDASTASFEYGGDSVVANSIRVPPMTTITSASGDARVAQQRSRAASAGAR